jgi:hypothetical protein
MFSAQCFSGTSPSDNNRQWNLKLPWIKYGIKPDIIIGCAGGGSTLADLSLRLWGEKLAVRRITDFLLL